MIVKKNIAGREILVNLVEVSPPNIICETGVVVISVCRKICQGDISS